jgi:hypothetical protein
LFFEVFILKAVKNLEAFLILIFICFVHAVDEFVFEGIYEFGFFRFSVSDFEKNAVELP